MGKRHTSLILLSIVAPISLLTAFRLSGILQTGQITYNTITTETAAYQMPRLSHDSRINQTVINDYDDTFNKLSFELKLYDYQESSSYWWQYYDSFQMGITLVANINQGFIDSCTIRFSYTNNSLVDVPETHLISAQNLELIKVKDMRLANSYVDTAGINRPRNCSLAFPVFWGLMDEPHQTQNMTISAEVVNFNGTVYQKFVIPIFLGVS